MNTAIRQMSVPEFNKSKHMQKVRRFMKHIVSGILSELEEAQNLFNCSIDEAREIVADAYDIIDMEA
jgi:hypothetical protein